jgi:hypothetical protein
MRTSLGRFDLPPRAWTDIARLGPSTRTGTRAGQTLTLLGSPDILVRGVIESALSGIDAAPDRGRIRPLRASETLVVARYAPQTAQLRIQLLRAERRPDGAAYVSLADFTPHMGEFWRAVGQFRTAAERDAGLPGFNPFEAHRGERGDPVFHRMSEAAVQVAIGLAMRWSGAPIAWLAIADHRVEVQSQTSGSLFYQRAHWSIDGLVRARWLLFTPFAIAPAGAIGASVCASPGHVVSMAGPDGPSTRCDDPAHQVSAGVWGIEWSGGNLPAEEAALTHAEGSGGGLTVLGYALAVGLVFAGSSALLPGEALSGVLGASAIGLYGSGIGVTSAPTVAAGAIKPGLASAIDAGIAQAPVPGDGYSAALVERIRAVLIEAPLGSSLAPLARFARGNCDPTRALADCTAPGQAAGLMPRVDALPVIADGDVLARSVQVCAKLGLVGARLIECAGPMRAGVFGGP